MDSVENPQNAVEKGFLTVENNTKYIELNIQNDNTSSTKKIVYKEDSGNNILEITIN